MSYSTRNAVRYTSFPDGTVKRGGKMKRVSGNALKSVAAHLADCQNSKTGLCCPSLRRIAEATHLSRETVCMALDWLEGVGLFWREQSRGGGNRYILRKTEGEPGRERFVGWGDTAPSERSDQRTSQTSRLTSQTSGLGESDGLTGAVRLSDGYQSDHQTSVVSLADHNLEDNREARTGKTTREGENMTHPLLLPQRWVLIGKDEWKDETVEESHWDTSRLVLPFPGCEDSVLSALLQKPSICRDSLFVFEHAARCIPLPSPRPRRVFVIVEDVGPNGPEGEVVFKPVLGWEEWLKTPEALDILLPPGTRRSDLSPVEYEAIKELTLESYDLREGPGDDVETYCRYILGNEAKGLTPGQALDLALAGEQELAKEVWGEADDGTICQLAPAPLCEWVVGQFEEEFEEGYEFTARELIDRMKGKWRGVWDEEPEAPVPPLASAGEGRDPCQAPAAGPPPPQVRPVPPWKDTQPQPKASSEVSTEAPSPIPKAPDPPPAPKPIDPHTDPAIRMEFARAQFMGLNTGEGTLWQYAAGKLDKVQAAVFDRWLKYRSSPPPPGDPLADREKRLAFVRKQNAAYAKHADAERLWGVWADQYYQWDDARLAEFYEFVKAEEPKGPDTAPRQ